MAAAATRRRRTALAVAAGTVLLVLLAAAAWRLHRSRSVQLFGELVTRVDTDARAVALTFDDGPAVPHTDSVLALLRRAGAEATFFVVGEAVERNPELARRIIAEGHELGNHSYSHRRMVLMRLATIRREVERTDSLIRAAGGTSDIHFRPPYGRRLVMLPWYLWRTGRRTVLWTLEPDSWFDDRARMTQHVLDNVEPGSIILLHVELRSRAEERAALETILSGLRQRGYRMVTVSELMQLSRRLPERQP